MIMKSGGYFHSPSIYHSKVVFVSEDDLWLLDLNKDKIAVRLTNSDGNVLNPRINSTGTKIAYSSSEHGNYEVYILDIQTGQNKQLTFLGGMAIVKGWKKDSDEIIFSSTHEGEMRRQYLYKTSSTGGEPAKLPYGVVLNIDFGPKDNIVIGRFYEDNARWKRYRGGLAGQILVTQDGNNFNKLALPSGNHVVPMFIGNKIYFLSDIDGISNLYSVNPDGSELKQLTFEKEYFLRKATHDDQSIIMQQAGDLILYNITSGELKKIEFTFISSREYQKNKFVNGYNNLAEVVTNHDSHALVISRGKPFYFAFWEEGVNQLGKLQGVRYRQPIFHPKENKLYIFSDELGSDGLEIYDLDDLNAEPEIIPLDIGIPYNVKISPTGEHLAIFNNRFQVVLLNIKTREIKIILETNDTNITSIDFSPDGKWIVYSEFANSNAMKIILYSIENKTKHELTDGDFTDTSPRFSPDGKYLYFLSNRTYKPIFDAQIFNYVFPKATRVYCITLSKDEFPPTKREPKPLVDKPKKNKKKNNDKIDEKKEDNEENKDRETVIDLDGLKYRISVLPISEDLIFNLEVTNDNIFFATSPIEGMDIGGFFGKPKPKNTIKVLSLKDLKTNIVMAGISSFSLSDSKNLLVVLKGDKVRVLPSNFTAKQENKEAGERPSRKSMYLDLNRIAFVVNPIEEWKQMVKETWRLMKDHYWDKNLGGIDWEKMMDRYFRLVEKIGSRTELSDLLWELQAETGSSHSYEFLGDYPKPPQNSPAKLGAEYQLDEKTGGYKITHLVKGDYWDENKGSPLIKAGVNCKIGDIILAIDGQKVSASVPIGKVLMHKVNQEVNILIQDGDTGDKRNISVTTIGSEVNDRYRDWVENNREYVHEKTKNKVGYLHIPDMGIAGVQNFYRYLKIETQFDALIVDVRYNGGGHTSQLFLEKLAKKRLGYNITRYGKKASPYPNYSIPGPMIAITNEHAGSDGDIFSHSFKMMKLGKLIGTRTWGGVIGIWPKVRLVDGTIVTQPEFSYYFNDVGYDVENYGTDPDIEVDYLPQDYISNTDPQLDKAIDLILEELHSNPIREPNFSDYPSKV